MENRMGSLPERAHLLRMALDRPDLKLESMHNTDIHVLVYRFVDGDYYPFGGDWRTAAQMHAVLDAVNFFRMYWEQVNG